MLHLNPVSTKPAAAHHAEDICDALKECEVVRSELARGLAIDLQYPIGGMVAMKDHVDRTMNAMFKKQFRRPEPFFIFKVI